eukprot:gene2363-8064_t
MASCSVCLQAICLFFLANALSSTVIARVSEQPSERLDQSQTGRSTTFHVPLTGIWQSFTPSLAGNLTRLEVLLGQAKPGDGCKTYDGTLAIYSGAGKFTEPYFARPNLLLQQYVEATSCRCTSVDCVVWQEFHLERPISVISDKLYSFFLSSPKRYRHTSFRVGLAVADIYTRGSSHFSAPGYDFTFKTFVDGARANVQLDEHSTPAIFTSHSNVSNDQASRVYTTAILASSICFGVAIAILVIFLVRRRNRRGERVFASSKSSPFSEDTSGWWANLDAAIEMPQPQPCWNVPPSHQTTNKRPYNQRGRPPVSPPKHTVLYLDFDEPESPS